MFYRYEHYMSISNMALIVAIVHIALIVNMEHLHRETFEKDLISESQINYQL